MGVHGLWPVLGAIANKSTLKDLEGKTLAIDLSTWIYESGTPKTIKGKSALSPHMRVLFWRVYHLLLNQVKPVFILEGESPALKKAELQRRQGNVNRNLQGSRDEFPSPSRPSTSGDWLGRSSFMHKVMECRALLDIFGIPYLEAKGEAEATCAALNQHNESMKYPYSSKEEIFDNAFVFDWLSFRHLESRAPEAISSKCKMLLKEYYHQYKIVDGCVTNDNDAFLFGAKVVYRNFSCNEKKVDKVICEYKMEDIETKLSLTRESLVAYALLSGCDYTKGAPHVGREKVLKFLNATDNQDIFDRLKSWKDDDTWYNLSAHKEVKKPKHCYRCAHFGSMETHVKTGCVCCDTGVSCNYRDKTLCTCSWHRTSRLYEEKKDEFQLRNKALQLPGFPDQQIIDIFLKNPPPDKKLIENIKWKKADWKELECFCQRMFPKNYNNIILNLMPVLISVENISLNRIPMEFSNPNDELADSTLSAIPEITDKKVEDEKIVKKRKARKRRSKLPSLEELAKQPRIDEIFQKKKLSGPKGKSLTIDQFFIKKSMTSEKLSDKNATVKEDTTTRLGLNQKTKNLPAKHKIFIDITELSDDEDQENFLCKEINVNVPAKPIECIVTAEPFVDHSIVPAKPTDVMVTTDPLVAHSSSTVPTKQQTYTDTLEVIEKENVNSNFLTKSNSTYVNSPAKQKDDIERVRCTSIYRDNQQAYIDIAELFEDKYADSLIEKHCSNTETITGDHGCSRVKQLNSGDFAEVSKDKNDRNSQPTDQTTNDNSKLTQDEINIIKSPAKKDHISEPAENQNISNSPLIQHEDELDVVDDKDRNTSPVVKKTAEPQSPKLVPAVQHCKDIPELLRKDDSCSFIQLEDPDDIPDLFQPLTREQRKRRHVLSGSSTPCTVTKVACNMAESNNDFIEGTSLWQTHREISVEDQLKDGNDSFESAQTCNDQLEVTMNSLDSRAEFCQCEKQSKDDEQDSISDCLESSGGTGQYYMTSKTFTDESNDEEQDSISDCLESSGGTSQYYMQSKTFTDESKDDEQDSISDCLESSGGTSQYDMKSKTFTDESKDDEQDSISDCLESSGGTSQYYMKSKTFTDESKDEEQDSISDCLESSGGTSQYYMKSKTFTDESNDLDDSMDSSERTGPYHDRPKIVDVKPIMIVDSQSVFETETIQDQDVMRNNYGEGTSHYCLNEKEVKCLQASPQTSGLFALTNNHLTIDSMLGASREVVIDLTADDEGSPERETVSV